MVEEIYNKLVCLSTYNEIKRDNQWATGEGINKCLNEIFGESASVVHCDLSSIDNPVESEDLSEAETYYQEIEQIIIKNSGFVKPIIAIWNTNSIKQQENRILPKDITGGSHWQTVVIVPSEYWILGKCITHETECIFFRDSLNPEASIPEFFLSYYEKEDLLISKLLKMSMKILSNKQIVMIAAGEQFIMP